MMKVSVSSEVQARSFQTTLPTSLKAIWGLPGTGMNLEAQETLKCRAKYYKVVFLNNLFKPDSKSKLLMYLLSQATPSYLRI